MISDLRFLDRVQVASPCPASWDGMKPVDAEGAVRYCGECRLNVYNLSEMTAEQAEALLREHEGKRLCVAFFRRADGTVLTRDCPVGLKIARRKAVVRRARMVVSLSAAFGSLIVPSLASAAPNGKQTSRSKVNTTRPTTDASEPRLMGAMVMPEKELARRLAAKDAKTQGKKGTKPSGKNTKPQPKTTVIKPAKASSQHPKHTVGKLIAKPATPAPLLLGGATPPKTEPVKPKAQTPPIVGRIAAPPHINLQDKPTLGNLTHD